MMSARKLVRVEIARPRWDSNSQPRGMEMQRSGTSKILAIKIAPFRVTYKFFAIWDSDEFPMILPAAQRVKIAVKMRVKKGVKKNHQKFKKLLTHQKFKKLLTQQK